MAVGRPAKAQVLGQIAKGSAVQDLGQAKVKIGQQSIHVRYRSNPKSERIWSFNANPNTLTADYELWVCGSADHYYLIPIAVIKEIYGDPAAYVDRRHPEIRVLEVDQKTHKCRYGSNRQKDFTYYFQAGF